MSIRRHGPILPKARFARWAICALPILVAGYADSPLLANNARQETQQTSARRQIVILLDINPNQQKVFALESDLAMGVLDHLDQRDAAVSVVTFGSGKPVLRSTNAKPSEAIDAIRSVIPEQSKERYASIHLYEAMNLALNQFTDDARSKSLLIIAEGREDFSRKEFKQIVFRARQLKLSCYVALVAGHSLRGSKSILMYGFYLSDLASKTHGQSIEVGDRRKKLPRSVERFSTDILNQSQDQRTRLH